MCICVGVWVCGYGLYKCGCVSMGVYICGYMLCALYVYMWCDVCVGVWVCGYGCVYIWVVGM